MLSRLSRIRRCYWGFWGIRGWLNARHQLQDAVLVDQSQTIPRSGYAFVLRQGDELLVKYCQLMPEGLLRVSSENESFEPYDINLNKMMNVSILGRVLASTHEW